MKGFLLFFLAPLFPLAAFWAGNPAQPALENSGIIHKSPEWWSFRLSYIGDYVYKQRFLDEFPLPGNTVTSTYIRLWTQAGMLTLNFRDRIDLYAILGGTRLDIDNDVTTSQQLSWGFGGKLIILREGRFHVGVDLKYFQTNQSPQYFLSEGAPYNIMSDFHFDYSEIQASLGIAYRTKYVSPYATASYLMSKLSPTPLVSLVRLPTDDTLVDVVSKSVLGRRRWGLVLGATLVDKQKATLSLEWRTFNQNSIDLMGEVQF